MSSISAWTAPDGQAVAVLCRGLFTPGYNQDPFRVQDNVHGAALRSDFGGYPLVDSFAEVKSSLCFEAARVSH